MAARLGDVLYWTGNGIAIIAYVGIFSILLSGFTQRHFTDDQDGWIAVLFLVAALSWLIGRACRYVLAGR